MGGVGRRGFRAAIGTGVAAAALSTLTLVTPAPVGAPPEAPATSATTSPPVSGPVVGAGESPAGRAGDDPAGGLPGEVVAWLVGLGGLLVVWCLAWRGKPPDSRITVRQGGAAARTGTPDHPASDDDPLPVHIKL